MFGTIIRGLVVGALLLPVAGSWLTGEAYPTEHITVESEVPLMETPGDVTPNAVGCAAGDCDGGTCVEGKLLHCKGWSDKKCVFNTELEPEDDL
jgi:hypothetical protein